MRGSLTRNSPEASLAVAAPASNAPVSSHGAGEAPERALGQMKRRVAVFARGRQFLAGDHEGAAHEDDRQRLAGHAREVDHELDAAGGFHHVARWNAFARCATHGRAVVQEIEDSPEVIGHVAAFEKNAAHRAHSSKGCSFFAGYPSAGYMSVSN